MGYKKAFIFLLSFSIAAGRLCGQAGPPMLTDDPGTPGPGKWELNLGWTTEHTPGTDLMALPEFDLNYGIGDRVELTYFVDYDSLQSSGRSARWGLSDSEFAVKWRFHDGGDDGSQVAVYPQVNFLTPGSRSDRRGLADGETSYQLPVEFEKDFRQLSLNIDLGRSFASGGGNSGWFGGICLGHQLAGNWDIDGEVHVDTDARASHEEAIANLATRIGLSNNCSLMFLIGRDVSNSLGPRASLLSYVGIQIRI